MMDILLSRSEDNGDTFSEAISLASGTDEHPTVNNPIMIEDKNGRIHFLYCEDYATNGGRVLRRYSDDDGISWSSPIDITKYTSAEFRNCFALGPGHGICLNNGRLLVPVWMVPKEYDAPIDKHGPAVVTTFTSDDNGETWRLGELLWTNREILSPNETTAAELSDGSVYLNLRNQGYKRAHAYSKDGVCDWCDYEIDSSLPDPHCFGSCYTTTDSNGDHVLLFVNCAKNNERTNVTVRASLDGGRSWCASRLIDDVRGGYCEINGDSKNGNIYVVYETNYGETTELVTLKLEDILN
jgi:sialidase-1